MIIDREVPIVALAALLCLEISSGAVSQQTLPSSGAQATNIPYVAARSILEAIPQAQLPAELRSKAPSELARDWPAWVSARDRDVRARLAAGDEDSIFNLVLFGTTFTKRPPLTERDIAAAARGATTDAVRSRIDELID